MSASQEEMIMNQPLSSIHWPHEFEPSRAPIYVVNRLTTRAAPEAVWECLIDATHWPEWYPNCQRVRLESPAMKLSKGVAFRWRTFGVGLVSVVHECVPNSRIAWDGQALGVRAYHAWLIEPKPEGGCEIITEETQYGAIARLGDFVFPKRMSKGHDMWLEKLSQRALAMSAR
jgi:hypothetical protein